MNIQFLSDAAGRTTAVLVPIKEWERLQKKQPQAGLKAVAASAPKLVLPRRAKTPVDPLLPRNQAEQNLVEAIHEMKEIIAGRQQAQPIEDFLKELHELSSHGD